jgi:hypothetical protein
MKATLILKMAVFWNGGPCSLVDTDRRSKGAYCLRHQSDYPGSDFFSSLGKVFACGIEVQEHHSKAVRLFHCRVLKSVITLLSCCFMLFRDLSYLL